MLLFKIKKDALQSFVLTQTLVICIQAWVICICSLLSTQQEQPDFNFNLFIQNQSKHRISLILSSFVSHCNSLTVCWFRRVLFFGVLSGPICVSSDKDPAPLPEMCLRQNRMPVSQLQGSIFKGTLYKLHSIPVGAAQCYEKSAVQHRAHTATQS